MACIVAAGVEGVVEAGKNIKGLCRNSKHGLPLGVILRLEMINCIPPTLSAGEEDDRKLEIGRNRMFS